MIWPNCLIIVLSAAFSTIHALNLPTLLNQTVELPSQLTSDWECSTNPFSKPPHYTDCEVAYKELPDTDYQAMFHYKGEDDGHRLPVAKSHNTCKLSVTLLEGLQDKSSWAEIAFKAETLNELCVNGKNDGGYIKTGENGRIWVILTSAAVGNGKVGGQVDVT